MLKTWIDLVNSSYGDCTLDIDSSRKLLSNHPFIVNSETFCFMTEKQEIACAISIGQFKENLNVGTVYRIAVANEYKRKGIGLLLVLFGYAKLRERGLKLGESIISSKRKPSFFLHLSLGFKPQYDNRYISFHGALRNTNFLQKIRLKCRAKKYYKDYIKYFNAKFENNSNWRR